MAQIVNNIIDKYHDLLDNQSGKFLIIIALNATQ